jgi:hypothetical protein
MQQDGIKKSMTKLYEKKKLSYKEAREQKAAGIELEMRALEAEIEEHHRRELQ